MYRNQSQDPRSIRARELLQTAFKELLCEKPFAKIMIKDIVERAGLARPTFYNHYESKEDLLNHMIDAVLDEFFLVQTQWNSGLEYSSIDPDPGKMIFIKFFQIWQDHAEVVDILNNVDIDYLLIERLKKHFERFQHALNSQMALNVGPKLGEYLINFNAYAFVGILQQWFRDGMKYSPEVMGEFLNNFAGAGLKKSAVEKFGDMIT